MATATATPAPAETKPEQITFDQAFKQAVEEHTPAAPPEPAVEVVPEATPAEVEVEQPGEETGTEPAPPQESSGDELLSDEEYNALKSDPVALRKALNRSYTQKTQQLAPYRKLIEAFERDPNGTLELLARERGMVLQKPTTEHPAVPTDQTVKVLKDALGPELDFLADKLGPAFQTLVNQAVGPVKQSVEMSAAQNEAQSVLDSFTAKHPEWKKHEVEMTRLAQVFQPAIGSDGKPLVTTAEYMENLFQLASRAESSAEQTKRVVARITKANGNVESPASGVSPNHIAPKPAGLPTIEEAFAAAKAGIRWEQ